MHTCVQIEAHVHVSLIHEFQNVGQFSRALPFGDDQCFLQTEV